MFEAVQKRNVFIYDGTNSAEILTWVLENMGNPTWVIQEEDEEGVIFAFTIEFDYLYVCPKVAPGDYLVMEITGGFFQQYSAADFAKFYHTI